MGMKKLPKGAFRGSANLKHDPTPKSKLENFSFQKKKRKKKRGETSFRIHHLHQINSSPIKSYECVPGRSKARVEVNYLQFRACGFGVE